MFDEMKSSKGEMEKMFDEMKWASPGKIDTKLSDFSLIFKIFRGHRSN